MKRQAEYMQSMLDNRASLETGATVLTALAEYKQFMGMFVHSREQQEPTPMVDLVWHTHMLFPHRYATECRQLSGCFVDHDDDRSTTGTR